MPLANSYRPHDFSDMVGQQHLIGNNGVLKKMGDKKEIQSMILYGPPGTGKTTAALILSEKTHKKLYKMNAVSASVTDIKKMIKENKDPVILYLDEIQYFNKKQQQALLPYIEDGSMTLIASTTENPYYDLYDAVLSRCLILEFHKIKPKEIHQKLNEIVKSLKREKDFNEKALHFLSEIASGDVRRAINLLELCIKQIPTGNITIEKIKPFLPTALMAGFDKDGNYHYQYVSAMQKSIRGSDPDAAVFWLTKILEGGDIKSPIRRLLVIAAEDIGLAHKEAITHTISCCDAALRLGLPECYYPLTQAVIYLALAPKSNSIGNAFAKAKEDIKKGLGATTPSHIAVEHPKDYRYPHNYPNHWVKQQYLPDDLQGKNYYIAGDNGFEQNMKKYWDYIKSQK